MRFNPVDRADRHNSKIGLKPINTAERFAKNMASTGGFGRAKMQVAEISTCLSEDFSLTQNAIIGAYTAPTLVS